MQSAWVYTDRTTSAEQNDVMSTFEMAYRRHVGFEGPINGIFEKAIHDLL